MYDHAERCRQSHGVKESGPSPSTWRNESIYEHRNNEVTSDQSFKRIQDGNAWLRKLAQTLLVSNMVSSTANAASNKRLKIYNAWSLVTTDSTRVLLLLIARRTKPGVEF